MVFSAGDRKVQVQRRHYILRHYHHHDMHAYDSSSNGVVVFLVFNGNDTIGSLGLWIWFG